MPGRGALGRVLFARAVELDERGFGRARLGVIPNASATSLAAFLDVNVDPGSCVITDGWSAYPAATRDCYTHHGTSVAASGLQAHAALPAVHRVFSLVKRWLMGTMTAGLGQPQASAGLLRRVGAPLHPSALAQPWSSLPYPHASGGRWRAP